MLLLRVICFCVAAGSCAVMRRTVKRQAVDMNNPNFYDMTKITTGVYDRTPIIIDRKPKLAVFSGVQQNTPVGMGAFFEVFHDGKLADAKGWDFDQTFVADPFQFGMGLPLYPHRLKPQGTAHVIHPHQFISLEDKKRRRKRQLMIMQPSANDNNGQKIYMVREQPGFRFNNYINQHASGDMMLSGFRMHKPTGQLRSWRLGGDLHGGSSLGFNNGIDWPAQMIDLSNIRNILPSERLPPPPSGK